ncbi:hypothetical protein N7448_011088 [Penicillium atrosanguineum]|nr:hypothetical protein N7448_011088 [Penicillium atrosanguineum]
MDLFTYNATYQIWICIECRYAVSPRQFDTHLCSHHRRHPAATTAELRQAALAEMLKRPWLEPTRESCKFPPPDSAPIAGLPVYPGLRCPRCSYVSRALTTLRSHLAHIHPETRRPRGRASKAKPDVVAAAEQVSCQRFFVSGSGSGFFSVIVPSPIRRQRLAGTVSEAEFIQVQVNRDLQERLSDEAEQGLQITTQKHTTEVSPWLELTQWPKYLQGHSFSEVASLGMLPDSSREPLLAAFAQSVERLIKRAYHTIQDRRINEFDQIRINSFVSRPRIWERPILVDLKPSTYARYQQVWQRLICFAYRTSRPDQAIILRHQLTTTQFGKLDQMEDLGTQFLAEQSPAVRDQLDHACLALSIALLDHPLKGDLFESTVIGFLAVLGVDVERQTFREPYGYTSYLSALVKMAQMLVVEQAVQMADDGLVAHPADALDDMRERFLLYGVRAPFGWISRLPLCPDSSDLGSI